jgi:hypothetical protein
MDTLIARIKERVADHVRAVDAARWVVPMPTVPLPATAAEVEAAEAVLGFAIPPLLRRLYTEVGNGGFGPCYGLEGVPTIPPTPGAADIVALYEQYAERSPEYPAQQWPRGLVPLISGGCLSMECVDFLRPPYAVVLFEGNACDGERPVIESLGAVASSLEERLEMWLAKPGGG